MTARISIGLIALLGLGACASLPGLDFAELTARPQYYALKLRGNSRMQSAPSGSIVNNASVDAGDIGFRDRDDDYGGVLAYGDGFSGFEFSYLNVDIDHTDRNVLAADFGQLPTGATVSSSFRMDEFKLGYTGRLLEYETDDELLLRLGAGLTIAHRDAVYDLREDGTGMSQQTRFADDGVPYITARARGDYRGGALQFDYGFSDFDFGGEFEGPMHDFAILGSYTLEDQDITFIAGYRWIDLPASGSDSDLAFDHDLRLEGYTLGVELRF